MNNHTLRALTATLLTKLLMLSPEHVLQHQSVHTHSCMHCIVMVSSIILRTVKLFSVPGTEKVIVTLCLSRCTLNNISYYKCCITHEMCSLVIQFPHIALQVRFVSFCFHFHSGFYNLPDLRSSYKLSY